MRSSLVRRRAGGQSLTELAFMMPLLALLLVGLVELGFLLHAHVQVSSAAREAARAASLYRSTRLSAFDNINNFGNLPQCVSGIDGWTLQQTIEQAVVQRSLNSNDCPTTQGTTGSTIEYSALGILDSTRAPAGTALPLPCPTTDVGGWIVGIHDPVFTQSSANQLPPVSTPDAPAAGQAILTLCYPHRMILASGLLNLGTPIWVNKSVVFEFQQ